MDGMDMLQGINDAEAEMHQQLPEDFKMPSLQQMLEMLETMDLPEEEKESLRKSLTDIPKSTEDFMRDFVQPAASGIPGGNPLMTYALILGFIVMLTLFVFFGYKLYRSLTEKERKRDEKRKQKQLKKKK